MTANQFLRRICAAGAGLCMSLAAVCAAAQEIRIGGTGNALGAMRLLGEAYAKAHPQVRIKVLDSLGTSGAVKAVPKGAIDIGLSSRPLSEEEARQGCVSIEYARTPLVFAVPSKSKVNSLTSSQLAGIFDGTTASWPDGTQIRVVLRQEGDDNTRQVRAMSAEMERALKAGEKRPGMPFAVTDQEAADKIESIPGALGVTTLGLIQSEKRQLRALALDGVEPTAANGAAGKYVHQKRFYFVTKAEPSSEVKQFIAFVVQSPVGKQVLARTGHWAP